MWFHIFNIKFTHLLYGDEQEHETKHLFVNGHDGGGWNGQSLGWLEHIS
jgi:hypothetical protein